MHCRKGLFLSKFNVPVNNFSVLWDGSTASWAFTRTVGSLKCLAQRHYTAVEGSNPGPLAPEFKSFIVHRHTVASN